MKDLKKQTGQQGFTLIELLVVISIVGLISSIILVQTMNARKRARDASRQANLTQLSKALEFYYDKYGEYPHSDTGEHNCPAGENWINSTYCPDTYLSGLKEFMAKLPPSLNGGGITGYAYRSTAETRHQTYKIVAWSVESGIITRDNQWAYCPVTCMGTGPMECNNRVIETGLPAGESPYLFAISNGYATCNY